MDNNKTIWKGEIADFWLDEHGILHAVTKACPTSIESVKDNVSLVNRLVCSSKGCGIFYVTQSFPYDLRSFKYMHKKLCNSFTAIAYVTEGHAKAIMFAMSDCLDTNVKFFDSARRAKRWIMRFLPATGDASKRPPAV